MIRITFVFLFLILFLILGIPVLGIEWLIGRFSKNTMDYSSLRIVQWGFNTILKITGVEITVIGEENVPDEPVLFIGNHSSYFDILITYARCKRLTGYIAKKELLVMPVSVLHLNRAWQTSVPTWFLQKQELRV